MIIKNYKKHNPIPTNEWSESRYSFNKNKERSLLLKKNIANRIIKGYFNLTHKEKTFKSRRMRNLIKRSSVIRLFNSKGMIKHNNDKVNINLYTFDKKKLGVLKNLYKFNKSLNKLKRYNGSLLRKLNRMNNPFYSLNNSNLNSRKILKLNSNKRYKLGVMSNFRLVKKVNVRYNRMYMKNMYYYYNTDYNKGLQKIRKLPRLLQINRKNKTIQKNLNILKNSQSSNRKNILNYKTIQESRDKQYKILNYKAKQLENKNKNGVNRLVKKGEQRKHSRSKRKLLFRSKRKMLINKRKLLYSNLIKTLPWSLKRNKIILYKMMVLRLFYMSMIRNMNLQLYIDVNNNCIIIKKNNQISDNLSKEQIINNEIKIILPERYNLLDINYNLKELKKTNNKKSDNNKKLINKMKILKWKRTVYINRKIEEIINILLSKYKSNNDSVSKRSDIQKVTDIYNIKKIIYNEFKMNNLSKLFKRYFLRQHIMIRSIYGSYINNEKLVGLTNNLKYMLNMIYNKKVFLNITNLKYLHLNPDMLSDALVIKLRNKNNNLRKMIGKTLKLIKLGKLNSNKLNNLNTVKTTNLLNIINEMYNLSIDTNSNNISNNNILNTQEDKVKYKIKETFKNLRHRWITGARLEGKGRLTSRYTAARALYKYRAKGNLKSKYKYYNKDYLTILKEGNKVSKKNPSVTLYRGISAPNLQYVKKSGFRRIGSFGIKLWINNNS